MADASDSKSDGGDLVWVQVPPSAVRAKTPNIAICDIWCLFLFEKRFYKLYLKKYMTFF